MHKIIILIIALILFVLFFAFDLHQLISLETLKAKQGEFLAYRAENPLQSVLIFGSIYVVAVALSLPGGAVLTLAAGALFGLFTGFILVSIASTLGASLAFLFARYVFGEAVQKKYSGKLARMNEGVKREGAFYLFALRLVPIFPFFLINLLMGLTKIRFFTYLWVSWIGMMPGTIAFVFAGTQLAKIESTKDILSPGLLIAFTILGLLPLILKKILDMIKRSKVLRGFKKPASFDYNIIAIGGGSAGLVTSYMGAALNAKVALIEKHAMGGDCLNTGCVPSKALIRTAKLMADVNNAPKYGVKKAIAQIDFGEVMARVKAVIKEIEPHDSIERYTKLGVDCHSGHATIIDPYRVEVNGKTLTTKNIVIATGARPVVPPISGLSEANHYTSDTLWELADLPKKLVVLGGGPIGCEMAQSFARLGSEVTLVEMAERLLRIEDIEASELLEKSLTADGVRVLTDHKATGFAGGVMTCEHDGQDVQIPFDAVIVALGRRPNVDGLGLDKLPIEMTDCGLPVVDKDTLQTSIPNIFVAGDVAGDLQFTHFAAHQAVYAALNALFGQFKTFKLDRKAISWATFTDPEVARVGLNEQEAIAQNIAHEVTTYDVSDLDRAIADSSARGFVKVLTRPGKDTILGVTIAAPDAGNLISEYTLAMQHGLGLNKILGTIHPYPTLSEANKYAASAWKQAHKPEWAMRMLTKFMTWQRG